jgi:hypothetical protein
MTILGLLAAIVSSGLRSGLRAWSKGNAELDDIRSSEASLSLLRGQIEGALPVMLIPGPNQQPKLSFDGDSNRLRLVSRSSFRDGPEAPPRWVEFSTESNGGAGRLLARETAMLPGADGPGETPLWQGAVLDGNQFRFEYLPRRLPNQAVGWVNTWPDSNLAMPAAVRLSYVRRGQQHQMILALEYAQNSWNGGWFR